MGAPQAGRRLVRRLDSVGRRSRRGSPPVSSGCRPRDAAGVSCPGRAAVSDQADRPVAAGARHLVRRHGDARPRQVVSMGVTAFIFELTRPKLLQLGWFRGSTSTCWCGSLGRTAWSIRSRSGCGNGCGCSRRSAPGARCGCCGASGARCAARRRRSTSEQMHGVRREQPDRHEADAEATPSPTAR